MKQLIVAITLAAGLIGPASGASWGLPGFQLPEFKFQLQGGKGGHAGQERGSGREQRAERRADRDDRRERLNDDERRALHRDLDKANRELYRK